MTLQQPRLSISNCVLPTAVDWVVLRKLREWHTASEQTVQSTTTTTPVCADPSPFWISAKIARYLWNKLTQENPTSIHTSYSSMNSQAMFTSNHTTSISKREGTYFSFNWNRAVHVFGSTYVNTADTSLSSIVDSTTCVSYQIPVDETGEVLWALISREFPSHSTKGIYTKQYPSHFFFSSPYWLNMEKLEKRWPGISIAAKTTPVYLKGGSAQCFINAEQTTDASRFNALSCIPQRRHQYLSTGGVQYFSWDFSEKLTRAFSDMRNHTCNIISSSSLMPLRNDKTDLSSSYKQQEEEEEQKEKEKEEKMETPSNLWLDVELIETAGWSVQSHAVAIEVPPTEIRFPPYMNIKNKPSNESSRIIVNAASLLTRDPLLDLIAYKPICLLTQGVAYVDAATTLRLAVFALTMKYTNNTWLCASLVQEKKIRGRKENNITGVEAQVHYSWRSNSMKSILINVDEVHITPEQLTELLNRERRMTVSSSV
ncbi:uncharacterized protein TM35_000073490 [Trypanosoma theileri]|uniref:Uncharacterized protein n=1 Tax=Trypanosoma theileri TaxID=67003 RepID=A0A1X0P202_9TRYP|nr:uncharacterized protein TM35_000073490 [Trypanosoma theileri]ORC90925.1 hypothetical protein TM35_000073490 [Trypanosoma theileri]